MKRHALTLATLLESFFCRYLISQRRASPATVAAYRDSLRLLVVFASARAGKPPSRLRLSDFDRDVVLVFLDHLETDRGNSIRTRNARLTAIRSFFQHASYDDPGSLGVAQRVLAIPGKRTSRRVVDYLRKDELNAILAAPDPNTPLGRRDHALIMFLSRTGARVSEAIAVNATDLHLEAPSQVLLHGKGAKDRVVPLATDAAAVLRGLCRERGLRLNLPEPVFVNARGQRLTRFGVGYILKRAADSGHRASDHRLQQRSVTPHVLRHTTAMHLLQSGVDLTTIQSWLGHSSVATTHHYLEADVEMKRLALAACDGEPAAEPIPFRPTDEVLALLDRL